MYDMFLVNRVRLVVKRIECTCMYDSICSLESLLAVP